MPYSADAMPQAHSRLSAHHVDDPTHAALCLTVRNRLAAALSRAVPEWQLLSGWVRTDRNENGPLGDGKTIIFGRGGVRSCQRHVNARMSFCEGL
jgi:hypothetical protein